jgi:NAD+---dinitrogen-reductase ADP-D-ribosyltransferase
MHFLDVPGVSRPDDDDPVRWYSTNFVGLPTAILASTVFNAHPRRLFIHGTRQTHGGLFRLLANCATQADAAEVFEHYMQLQFELGPPVAGDTPAEQSRHVASYLNLLRGWNCDSNSAQGAVLKGWVESRFGLVPVFHKERLGRFPSPAWVAYLEEKMGSRFHNNCINLQLDLLYEYCQWSLRRFGLPGARFIHLWRGSNDLAEQVVEGSLCERRCVLRLNNLLSFSTVHERAEEFGDWIIETDVPVVKLVFFPGLLRSRVLSSEQEYLVIGGCYRVQLKHGDR